MTATANAENLRQYKISFSLILEQILAFASSPNMFREIQNLSPHFQTNCVMMFYVIEFLVWIVASILSLNSKQFHKKLY